jgi:hypothetical protein
MDKIVDGMIMGVRVYGKCTIDDMKNFGEFANALDTLKKSLAKMFDEKIAEMVMSNILRDTKINITDGEVENEEMWESLYQLGIVGKSKSQTKSVVCGRRILID